MLVPGYNTGQELGPRVSSQMVGWLISGHLHWGILLVQTSFHSKAFLSNGSQANSHLVTRESSKLFLMKVYLLMKKEKLVADGLPL